MGGAFRGGGGVPHRGFSPGSSKLPIGANECEWLLVSVLPRSRLVTCPGWYSTFCLKSVGVKTSLRTHFCVQVS